VHLVEILLPMNDNSGRPFGAEKNGISTRRCCDPRVGDNVALTTNSLFLPRPRVRLRGWRGWLDTRVEQLRDGSDKLGRGEGLGQKNAVGDAVRGPLLGCGPGHVDDGKGRLDLSCLPCDIPAVHCALQVYVGNERPVMLPVALQQRHGFLARGDDRRFVTAIAQRLVDECLNQRIVFNDQDNQQIWQNRIPRQPTLNSAHRSDIGSGEMYKSELGGFGAHRVIDGDRAETDHTSRARAHMRPRAIDGTNSASPH
jgi:hypothetical protein